MSFFCNGHKDGRGTHISIFMEIQPGEYDALLPWPFSHKVNITLLDQSNTAEVLFLYEREEAVLKINKSCLKCT